MSALLTNSYPLGSYSKCGIFFTTVCLSEDNRRANGKDKENNIWLLCYCVIALHSKLSVMTLGTWFITRSRVSAQGV